MAAKDASSADNKVRTTKDDYIKGEDNGVLFGIIYKKLLSSNLFGNQVRIEYYMYWCDEGVDASFSVATCCCSQIEERNKKNLRPR